MVKLDPDRIAIRQRFDSSRSTWCDSPCSWTRRRRPKILHVAGRRCSECVEQQIQPTHFGDKGHIPLYSGSPIPIPIESIATPQMDGWMDRTRRRWILTSRKRSRLSSSVAFRVSASFISPVGRSTGGVCCPLFVSRTVPDTRDPGFPSPHVTGANQSPDWDSLGRDPRRVSFRKRKQTQGLAQDLEPRGRVRAEDPLGWSRRGVSHRVSMERFGRLDSSTTSTTACELVHLQTTGSESR